MKITRLTIEEVPLVEPPQLERDALLREHLAKMLEWHLIPANQAEVLRLLYLEERTVAEVAKMLNSTTATVRADERNGLQQLRFKLGCNGLHQYYLWSKIKDEQQPPVLPQAVHADENDYLEGSTCI